MKKTARRFLSMLLALSMVFGMMVFPVSATENEESAAPVETAEDAAPAAETTEEAEPASQEEAEPASQEEAEVPVVTVTHSSFPYRLNADDLDLSNDNIPTPEDVEVDENAPEIIAVTDELKGIKVLNADGESVPLTPGEIQAVLAYYQQYLDILSKNRNIYGIQTPFFLNFNDEGEDGLGILGEMLVLAGYSVADVRAGNYAYMDLVMMIKTFTYTYGLGAEYYGNAILKAQREALQAVKDSGAKTEVQKLLVLNSWLAQNNTFDMPYIMNTDKDEEGTEGYGTIDDDEKLMEAPNGPQTPENYDKVEAYVKEDLTDFFTAMFHDQIYAAVLADLRQQYYENAIWNTVYNGSLAQAQESVKESVVEDYRKEKYNEAYEEKHDEIWNEEYEKAYTELKQADCAHATTVYTFDWAEDASSAIATKTCQDCGKVLGQVKTEVIVELKEKYVEPNCTNAGQRVYQATAVIDGTTCQNEKAFTLPADPDAHKFNDSGECEFCHQTKTELCDHSEAKAKFTWHNSEGVISATADIVCAEEDCTHVFEKDVPATLKEDTVDATCSTTGRTTYTATVTHAEETFSDTYVVILDLDPNAHVDEDGNSACDLCGHTVSSSGTSETLLATEDELKEQAEEKADEATDARKSEIEEYANAEADKAVDALTDDKINKMAEEKVKGDEETETEYEKSAAAAADQFMEENSEAIKEDPVAFVDSCEMFQQEVPVTDADGNPVIGEDGNPVMMTIAQQLHAGCEQFLDEAENGEGIEVDPVNAPGYKMTVEELTQQTMANEKIVDMDGDGKNDTTPNDAIPMYVAGTTPQLTEATINGWKGCHIGAFGFGTSVCLGYAMAYTYLIQCMHPEVYGISDDADMTVTDNWKTREEVYGEDLETSNYLVDTVRVTFDTEVTMFGPDNSSNFGEVHFWNAVKVDGQWYYIDPCYVDVYMEVMSRDRVETDGNMNHLYFMFSHTSAVDMYDGYTNTSFGDDSSGITSLYANKATNKSYEDSWISRINCVPYFANGYAYYVYDSTDLLTILEDSEENPSEVDYDASYKLVRHDLSKKDKDDGDTDYFTLIVFNGENSDGEVEARVYNPETKETVRNELLTELVNRHTAYSGVYPSVEITSVLYGGKLYFNLANCILSLDLETYEVALVKEYNTVYGVRDDNVAFGGRAFSITTEDNADFMVENHPIAALSLKDGELTVSIATNFALISGKKDRTNPAIALEDGTENGYGYAYEESNFNPKYNAYFNNDEGEQYGYEKEINDNDEFMWSANFVEKLNMSHFAGDSHTYEAVTVAAFCDMDGFTENRCTTCGAIEADSRTTEEGTAHEHHFVKFDEVYYTKDDSGSWNRGTSYVCAMCSYAVAKPTEPGRYADEEEKQEYEDKLAEYEAAAESAGHTYIPDEEDENTVWADDNTSVTFKKLKCSNVCPTRKPYLDALLGDDSISVDLEESVTAQAEVVDHEGDCATGAIAVYAASGEAEGYAYTATKKVQQEAGKHSYTGTFHWTEVKDEDGNPTGEYTATADVTCGVCGDSHEGLEAVVTLDEENSTEPSCTVAGKKVYVATVTVTDDEGKEIGSASESKEVPVEKLGHDYDENGVCKVCGAGSIQRIAGSGRYETAMAIADELKEAMGVETFDTILIASGNNFPDALAGSYLAVQEDAPILLAENKANSEVNGVVLDYIEKNLDADGKVYILGGTVAVSQAFEDGLKEAGIVTQRLAGTSRFETCMEILKEAGMNGNEILVCTGWSFYDALSVSALNKPILLVDSKEGKLTDEQVEYLDALEGDYTFYIIGGTAAVPEAFETELAKYGTVERVAGAGRYETAVAVAEKFFENPDCAALAYAGNYPDGLCGGPLAYKNGAPLLLVDAKYPNFAADYVEANSIKKGIVFGGTKVITDDTVATVFGLE